MDMNRFRGIIIVLLVVVIGWFGWKALSSNINIQWPSLGSNSIINNQTQTIVQEENAIISVVDETAPSVVAIGVTQRIINPFQPFSAGTQQNSTIGTGFVVSKEQGIIVTNRHVVADPNGRYSVVTKDGDRLEIENIYLDPILDLALVKVKAVDLPALELGDSSKLKVGQTAIAIGNALGRFDNTVTTGIISGMGRAVVAGDPFGGDIEQLDNLIQTDAAINPGNSGGPLLNSAGQVIGVNVATTEGAQNIGFAIPINSVKAIVDEFSRTGKISRPYLGVRYRMLSRDVAILNEVPQGAYIQDVINDSPADRAGLKAGDIITKFDNQSLTDNASSVTSSSKLTDLIQSKKVDDSLTLNVWSDGQERTVNVTLADTPSSTGIAN